MNRDNFKKENSFRNIMKGTSIFGGVQIFNILISAVRLKFVAMILGPAGMGVAGLLNTASLSIQQLASLGLNLAVVKEIGESKSDETSLRHVLAAIRPIAMLTALAGALICLLFPGLLSDITFGNQRYQTAFLILSAAVFFSIAGTALMSVLQGLHDVKHLSKASVIGSSVGLIVGVPLYWLWGTDGIAPAMVALSLATCLWYYMSLRKTLQTKPAQWEGKIHLPIVKRILVMGLILMSNELFKSLVNYIVNIYVREAGGEIEVGFYQSCSTMTSQYSAIVFTAMAMDYLPRLSAASSSNPQLCEVVNRQVQVVGLLITPVVCAVILLAPWVIMLLQTEAFIVATPLLRLLAVGVALRGLMYPLGYIVFAKDNRRLFFWMESVGANILTLVLTCLGYKYFGLDGLGYASIMDCAVCFAVYVIVNQRLYEYKISGKALRITMLSVLSVGVMTAICFCMKGIVMIVPGIVLLIGVSLICLRGLVKLWKN